MTTPGQAPVASVAEAAERSHFALRRAMVDVAMGLLHAGVLSHSRHADLSARVGPGTVLIATLNRTRDLVPDDLAVVRLDGSVAEGDLGGMSTEVVAMHTEVYRARPQAGAVIHTHSPHLLAFALAGRPLPARYEPLPRLGQAEEVPVAPPAPVAACIELIKARPGTQAVLLGGHGVLAFGPDTEATVSLLVALEEAAEAELRTAVLGRLSAPPRTLHIWGMAAGAAVCHGGRIPGAVLRPGLRLAVPHQPDHACLLGRPDRLLHRAGGHRAAQVVHRERIELVIAAILHGLNDWSRVNGHWLWIVVTIVSGVLFLGYAKVGSRSDLQVPDPRPPASGRHGLPPERPPAAAAGGHPALVGALTGPASPVGSAADRIPPWLAVWTSAFAS
jgi:L-ribulose-5-phosphate 4-epimerase